jgi:hypothetical protein
MKIDFNKIKNKIINKEILTPLEYEILVDLMINLNDYININDSDNINKLEGFTGTLCDNDMAKIDDQTRIILLLLIEDLIGIEIDF